MESINYWFFSRVNLDKCQSCNKKVAALQCIHCAQVHLYTISTGKSLKLKMYIRAFNIFIIAVLARCYVVAKVYKVLYM